MADRVLTVVCAWCHRIIAAPRASVGVTHTMCPACVTELGERNPQEPSPPASHDLAELR